MYRQSKEQYGTWDMLCGSETQVRTCPPSPGLGWGGYGLSRVPNASCLRRS